MDDGTEDVLTDLVIQFFEASNGEAPEQVEQIEEYIDTAEDGSVNAVYSLFNVNYNGKREFYMTCASTGGLTAHPADSLMLQTLFPAHAGSLALPGVEKTEDVV